LPAADCCAETLAVELNQYIAVRYLSFLFPLILKLCLATLQNKNAPAIARGDILLCGEGGNVVFIVLIDNKLYTFYFQG